MIFSINIDKMNLTAHFLGKFTNFVKLYPVQNF
jgi:hypothetical protein